MTAALVDGRLLLSSLDLLPVVLERMLATSPLSNTSGAVAMASKAAPKECAMPAGDSIDCSPALLTTSEPAQGPLLKLMLAA